VLEDITKEAKLKKTETKDKTALPDKKELAAQIKDEKQSQAVEDNTAKVLADVSKGEKKLKKKLKQLTNQRKRRKILLQKFKLRKRPMHVIKH